MLLWALARVGHNDPPALLWITQRAATQVRGGDHPTLQHDSALHAGLLCAWCSFTMQHHVLVQLIAR
jgi:predicted metal-binding membrane protein